MAWYAALAVLTAVAAWWLHPQRCVLANVGAAVRGKIIAITGASSGIGAELTQQYAAAGALLAISARRVEMLEEVATKARALGTKVLVVRTDMSDAAQVEHFIAATVAAYGGIDVLFLNHASVDNAIIMEYNNTSEFEKYAANVIRANVLGSMNAAHAALPHLAARGGHIAVVSSVSAFMPAPFHAAYAASKRALHGYFESLRMELEQTRTPVTVGLHILGMIGTPDIMKDVGNHAMAMPVPDCAAQMICAAHERTQEALIPHWNAAAVVLMRVLGTPFTQWSMDRFYLRNVPDYVRRLAAAQWTGVWHTFR